MGVSMQNAPTSERSESASRASTRLHYLDWLGVLAILGVFLFHAVHPFDTIDWEIKNAEQSEILTLFIVFFAVWGMPLFFLLAGAGSQFALRRRTGRQYASERFKRLFIPFIVGSIVLAPVQMYLKALNQRTFAGSFLAYLPEFFGSRRLSLSPKIFGSWGIHLWFLGFLFAFSLIALPLFLWLRQDRGHRIIDRLGKLGEVRGGVLLFFIPLVLVRLVFQPLYPDEHDWTDFIFLFIFFVLGYILYADQRFTRAMRRDGKLIAAAAIGSALVFVVGIVSISDPDVISTPGTPVFIFVMCMWGIVGCTWPLFILAIGMRFLDFTSKRLEYWREAQLPFFLLHQPVIVVIAFYVVQSDAGILPKLLTVVLSSFLVTLGLYELFIRRIKTVRALFGMKPRVAASGSQQQTRSREVLDLTARTDSQSPA